MIEINTASSILDLISNTPIQGLILLSILILPPLLASWVYLMNQLKIREHLRLYTAIGLLVLYVFGLILLKQRHSKVQQLQETENIIVDYLNAQHFHLVGFNEVRDEIRILDGCTDAYFTELAYFSDDLVLTHIKPQKPYYDTLGLREKDYNEEKEKLSPTILELKNYCLAKKIKSIGFKACKKYINSEFDETHLNQVIQFSPDIIPATFLPADANDTDTTGLEIIKF